MTMDSTVDQRQQNDSRLPPINTIPMRDMIRESDPSKQMWSEIQIDTEQDHTHEVREEEIESNEQEGLLENDPSRACPV
jgi:hypothetical protein